jgi:hypothetical protein
MAILLTHEPDTRGCAIHAKYRHDAISTSTTVASVEAEKALVTVPTACERPVLPLTSPSAWHTLKVATRVRIPLGLQKRRSGTLPDGTVPTVKEWGHFAPARVFLANDNGPGESSRGGVLRVGLITIGQP